MNQKPTNNGNNKTPSKIGDRTPNPTTYPPIPNSSYHSHDFSLSRKTDICVVAMLTLDIDKFYSKEEFYTEIKIGWEKRRLLWVPQLQINSNQW